MLSILRGLFAVGLVAMMSPAAVAQTAASAAVQVLTYFSPEENLEAIDIGLLQQTAAGSDINLAGYVLSDYRVIDAISGAAARGAWVRIYLDPGELRRLRLGPDHPLVRLSQSPNVEIRVKSAAGELMHLKGYTINGTVLRTGSANLSASGLKQQDNDLVLIYSIIAAHRFNEHFDAMWSRADNTSFSATQ